MKFFVHYTIWNKEDHISWICDALAYFPKIQLDFVFDNCTDNSINKLISHKIITTHDLKYYQSNKKLKWPNTNDAIQRFMLSDCDIFITPQDDMKLQDKFIFENLTNLFNAEENIGIVGMRDGILGGKFYSSCHSPGGSNTTYLKSGEYKRVDFVNDGPIAFNKKTIEKVGLFDIEYWAHFNDNDYCFRCSEIGLNNYVMGAEIVHEKWGSIQASEVWSQEYSEHDWGVYRRKWPNKQ